VCPAWRLLLEINSQPSSPSNNTHVATGIGEQLSAVRSARGIELEEVEERTKIRKRYLRAMEEERWELLPGAAYARAFLRTYAEFLALDGEALVEEYRRSHDSREVESDAEPVRQIAMAAPPRPRLPGRAAGVLRPRRRAIGPLARGTAGWLFWKPPAMRPASRLCHSAASGTGFLAYSRWSRLLATAR
jgi:transcriptional regulator with XRE-family HTH domain